MWGQKKYERAAQALAEARRYLEVTASTLEEQTKLMGQLQEAVKWLADENQRLRLSHGETDETPEWIAKFLNDLDNEPDAEDPSTGV